MFEKEFETIFKIAKQKGIDKFDIFLIKNSSFSLNVFKQNVEEFSSSDMTGLSIRVINGKKVGYAYTEKFDADSFDTILNMALENSRIIEDEKEIDLINFPDLEMKVKTFYPELEEINIDAKIDIAMKLESFPLGFDKRIINVPHAQYGDMSTYLKIANSSGLSKEYKSNGVYGFSYCLAKDDKMNKGGSYFDVSHYFGKIDPKHIGERAAQKALELLGAREIKSGQYPIIFDHSTAATMLQTFANIFSAKSVQEGQSRLKGKLGQNIATEKITIVDDALYEKGWARPFDAEGYPSQKTELIKNGLLNSFIHNTITAKKDNTKSTGNASRSYKGTLGISSSNMYITNGDVKKNELYGIYPKSIEIVSLAGMHSGCSSISGDFSLSAQGFLCENGARKYPIHNFTVSGNFFEMLNNITALADDLKLNMSQFGSPTFLVEKLNISG
ncbi:MAG: TldD/PmbA family protein [Candidatus Cloacimonadota bacterium]|nr:TldD/PmbA family protein [Candidatus Cloacimonadota bacterium]